MDFEAIAAKHLAGRQVYSGGTPYTRQFGEIFATALNTAYAAGRAGGIEEAAKVADEEADAMLAQRDAAIDGTFGGRRLTAEVSKHIAAERRVLAEGYIGLSASIRALAGKEGE
jgi:hypothetical protein